MELRRSRSAVFLVVAIAVSLLAAGCGGAPKQGQRPTLTVYSATGLALWYKAQFDKFTKETGVDVNLFEGGSGEVVSRINSGAVWDRLNRLNGDEAVPPADLLVTLPPFIQKAERAGLLQAGGADTTGIAAELVGPGGVYVPIVKTALCFIANPAADPQPTSWQDLLSPRFKGKLAYSTPGEAGAGTAVLILLKHLMGERGALDYLARLKINTAGSANSTASLQPKVDSGELLVANGDVQMNLASINNDGSKFAIFFPAMPDGTRTTVSLPYFAGVTATSHLPEEAKRLLAFLLSEEAQKAVSTVAFGIPVRDSLASKPAEVLNGVTLWAPDWNTVLVELESDVAAYQQAVR